MTDLTPGEPGAATASAPATPRPPIARIVAAALGAVGIVVGLAALVACSFLVWAHASQRDDDGFFTTRDQRFETVTYALSSDEIDLGADPAAEENVPDLGDLATVRLRVDPVSESAVFVGIGPSDDVDAYLDGVAHARVERVGGRGSVTYDHVAGGAPSGAPGDQGFWAAQASGSGPQTVDWDVESGQWSVVVMNADASEGVGVDASVGVEANWVLGVGLGLGGFGLFSLLVGTVLLVVGAIGVAHRLERDPAPGPARRGAVTLTGHLDEPGRWLWIVKPILIIPHVVVLIVLWIGVFFVSIAAFFSILFTRRYPRSLFDYTVGVLRWSWRVGFYSFSALGTDRYPPFRLTDPPGAGDAPDRYPADFDVAYAPELSRRLVLVKWWLLIIPHAVVLAIVLGSSTGGQGSAPGLLYLLVAFAGLALLFTRRYPPGLYDLVLGLDRWVYRVMAYVLLLTDEYPPFRLDQGPEEPPPPT